MKKMGLFILVIGMLGFVMTACSQSKTEQTEINETLQEEAEELPEEDQEILLTLYMPNESADGFVVQEEKVADITAETIVEKLIEAKVLRQETKINDFELLEENNVRHLKLDWNAAFLEQLNSTGTAGESVLMGSVVNTFLTAFDAESITVTVEGEIPESGHCIYDEPLRFYEMGEGEL